jgi:thioredoxin reductase (NADPH)
VDGVGSAGLESVTVRERDGGTTRQLPAAALFVLIGAEPRTSWLAGTVALDDRGSVRTGPDLLTTESAPRWRLARPPMLLETSLPGVFAAGDVRSRSIKRVAAAAGEGATAVSLVHEYLAARGS